MYKILDPKQTTELLLIRHGWLSPEYELTSNADSYGILSYNGISRRNATATSGTGTWVFRREALFSRTILITDQNGILIGKTTRDWFSRRNFLTLNSGFQAEFYRPLFWFREYIWESKGYGQIMHIKHFPLNLRDPVYIDQSMAPPALIPLLIFLGAYLTILRSRRRAAR
jgi:hypothetical protein